MPKEATKSWLKGLIKAYDRYSKAIETDDKVEKICALHYLMGYIESIKK